MSLIHVSDFSLFIVKALVVFMQECLLAGILHDLKDASAELLIKRKYWNVWWNIRVHVPHLSKQKSKGFLSSKIEQAQGQIYWAYLTAVLLLFFQKMFLYKVILKVRVVYMRLIELIFNHSSFSRNSALQGGKEINRHTPETHILIICMPYIFILFTVSVYLSFPYRVLNSEIWR